MFVQLPAVVTFLCGTSALLIFRCKFPSALAPRELVPLLAGLSLLLLTPYPLTVAGQQLISLLSTDPRMELLGAILLFGEGSMEASPQLFLLLYIVASDSKRDIALIQWISIGSSVLSISKSTVEMFCSDSYSPGLLLTDIVPVRSYVLYCTRGDREVLNRDSLLNDDTGRSLPLLHKIWTMIKVSPAFLTSLGYRVGSSVVVLSLLPWHYAALYFTVGSLLAFTVVLWSRGCRPTNDEDVGTALFYALTSITVLAKCPLASRAANFHLMLRVSLVWLALHSAALAGLLAAVGRGHWAPRPAHRLGLTGDQRTFRAVCGALLALGPASILALMLLRRQVEAMDRLSSRMLWRPDGQRPAVIALE
jgi:hypothetical protein